MAIVSHVYLSNLHQNTGFLDLYNHFSGRRDRICLESLIGVYLCYNNRYIQYPFALHNSLAENLEEKFYDKSYYQKNYGKYFFKLAFGR